MRTLYVSKGSGGIGDDGLFQVLNGSFPNATLAQVVNGTGAGVPAGGTNNTIVQLLGNPATNPNTNAPSLLTPFGFSSPIRRRFMSPMKATLRSC